MKSKYIIFLIVFCLTQNGYSQIMNTYVEAILSIEETEEMTHITAMAQNKTDVIASITYKLSVIKHDLNDNQSKNDQSGRKVIEPFEKLTLSKTSINKSDQERVIILLLLYDVNNKLIGNSRYVLNDNKDLDSIKQELSIALDQQNESHQPPSKVPYSNITFKGIVVDETKTKAGKDFYQLYYTGYLSQNINSEHIITITESITLGNNTKITIKTNGNTIFEFFVQTKYDFLKSMSQNALRLTTKYLEHLKLNEKRIQIY